MVGGEESLLTVKVVTDESFSCYEGFNLAVYNKGNSPLHGLLTFRIPSKEQCSRLKSRVSQHFGYSNSQVKLWVINKRTNRVYAPIPEDQLSLGVFSGLEAGYHC